MYFRIKNYKAVKLDLGLHNNAMVTMNMPKQAHKVTKEFISYSHSRVVRKEAYEHTLTHQLINSLSPNTPSAKRRQPPGLGAGAAAYGLCQCGW
jgi:hypothetical protein